jgi:hypothetical protein
MIADVLTKIEISALETKSTKSLKLYGKIFNHVKQKEKFKNIYPLRASGFTFQEAKNLGFKVCKHQWSNCINLRKRNLGNFYLTKSVLNFK